MPASSVRHNLQPTSPHPLVHSLSTSTPLPNRLNPGTPLQPELAPLLTPVTPLPELSLSTSMPWPAALKHAPGCRQTGSVSPHGAQHKRLHRMA